MVWGSVRRICLLLRDQDVLVYIFSLIHTISLFETPLTETRNPRRYFLCASFDWSWSHVAFKKPLELLSGLDELASNFSHAESCRSGPSVLPFYQENKQTKKEMLVRKFFCIYPNIFQPLDSSSHQFHSECFMEQGPLTEEIKGEIHLAYTEMSSCCFTCKPVISPSQ